MKLLTSQKKSVTQEKPKKSKKQKMKRLKTDIFGKPVRKIGKEEKLIAAGFWANTLGEVFSPDGKQVNIFKSNSYPSFSAMSSTVFLHRFVWRFFHGKPVPENMIVDRIDRDPYNCKIENLELVTRSESNKRRVLPPNFKKKIATIDDTQKVTENKSGWDID